MARTALLYAAPALLVAVGWLRLEDGSGSRGDAFWIAVLALLPAFVRPVWGRVVAAVLVSLLAAQVAFGLSALDARPFDDTRDYVGPLLTAVKDGALRFYDVSVPFPPQQEPEMHGAMLLAIFVFCLAIALGLAARRPLVAALALVAGAAWPATLVSTGFARGVVILAGVLSILAWGGRRAPHNLRPAIAAGIVLGLAALGATSSEAVAKSEFLSWKRWDPYDRPDRPVGVRYVWDANYNGVSFPEKVTTVLTVDGPERSLYWRATTLDAFEDDRWIEELRSIGSSRRLRLLQDPLLPLAALDQSAWVRADVTVHALLDRHLPGPSVPVAYDPRGAGNVNYDAGGVAVLTDGLKRGMRYSVWAYAPRPTPLQLARSPAPQGLRNTVIARYLEIERGIPVLPFGAEGRDEQLDTLLASDLYGQSLRAYEPLYDRARTLTAAEPTPYGAAVTIEAWLRSHGGFTYDEQPSVGFGKPALVGFVEDSKRGYCQHFAGAMTLMLRSLGIPSRVAVGFTSGAYDASKRRWTVTDHDAHAWVEVWFDGYGWVPFDPTPGRGQLSGSHSTASPLLNTRQLGQIAGRSPSIQAELARTQRERLEGTSGAVARDVPGDLEAIGGTVRTTGGSLLRLLALLGVLAVAAIALAKLAVRRWRFLTRDPRRVSAACRAELVDFLADQGIKTPRSATLADLGETVSERLFVDADPFVAAAGAARFAPEREARDAARQARRELRQLRRRLRRRLSIGERVRGLVSVRSLGLTG